MRRLLLTLAVLLITATTSYGACTTSADYTFEEEVFTPTCYIGPRPGNCTETDVWARNYILIPDDGKTTTEVKRVGNRSFEIDFTWDEARAVNPQWYLSSISDSKQQYRRVQYANYMYPQMPYNTPYWTRVSIYVPSDFIPPDKFRAVEVFGYNKQGTGVDHFQVKLSSRLDGDTVVPIIWLSNLNNAQKYKFDAPLGQWTDIYMKSILKLDATGYLYIYINGVLVASWTNIQTVAAEKSIGYTVGAYTWYWKDAYQDVTDCQLPGCVSSNRITFTPNIYTTSLSNYVGKTANVYTVTSHGVTGGSLPTGLSAETNYYVININGWTCQLSLTPDGEPVSIGSNGTGYLVMVRRPDHNRVHYYMDAVKIVTGSDCVLEDLLLSAPPTDYPPSIVDHTPAGEQLCTTDPRDVTIGVYATDDTAVTGCKADTVAETAYGDMDITLSQSGNWWTATASGLSCGTSTTYYAKCTDGTNTTDDYSFTVTVRPEQTITPPGFVRLLGGGSGSYSYGSGTWGEPAAPAAFADPAWASGADWYCGWESGSGAQNTGPSANEKAWDNLSGTLNKNVSSPLAGNGSLGAINSSAYVDEYLASAVNAASIRYRTKLVANGYGTSDWAWNCSLFDSNGSMVLRLGYYKHSDDKMYIRGIYRNSSGVATEIGTVDIDAVSGDELQLVALYDANGGPKIGFKVFDADGNQIGSTQEVTSGVYSANVYRLWLGATNVSGLDGYTNWLMDNYYYKAQTTYLTAE